MIYDILIIGSGPAGLTAAIYATRAQKKVLIIEKETVGGNITRSPKIENYPGYSSISGLDLADKLVNQVMEMNVMFEIDEVLKMLKNESSFTLIGEHASYEGKSVIIATGSQHRALKLDNEVKWIGHGISYCAVCDGPFYTNKEVVVIGGGNSALQEALLLSSYCSQVTIIQNLSYLTGEKSLIQQVLNTSNIHVIYNKIVTGLHGEMSLKAISLFDLQNQENSLMETESIFVAIGQEANNQIFEPFCSLDQQGFIITDELCKSSTEGVFIAGDCRHKAIRQIVTASSDGAIAALQAILYLDSRNT